MAERFDLPAGGVGSGFGPTTASDLNFLNKALEQQEKAIELQGKELGFLREAQRAEQEQYAFERVKNANRVVDAGRGAAAQFYQEFNADDPDALEQLHEFTSGLPAEIMQDGAVRQMHASAMNLATTRYNVKKERERETMGAVNNLFNFYSSIDKNGQIYAIQIAKDIADGKISADQAFEDTSELVADSTMINLQKAIKKLDANEGRAYAEKFKLPQGSIDFRGAINPDAVLTEILSSDDDAITPEVFSGMDTRDKIELMPRILAKANARFGLIKSMSTKRQLSDLSVNQAKLEILDENLTAFQAKRKALEASIRSAQISSAKEAKASEDGDIETTPVQAALQKTISGFRDQLKDLDESIKKVKADKQRAETSVNQAKSEKAENFLDL